MTHLEPAGAVIALALQHAVSCSVKLSAGVACCSNFGAFARSKLCIRLFLCLVKLDISVLGSAELT